MALSRLVKLGAGAAGVVVGLFVAERLRPLRRREELRHGVRLAANATVSATASVASAAALSPAFDVASADDDRRGLTGLVAGPQLVRDAAAVVLLDLGYYWWHRANHEVRLLWRFHNVHHIDPELDLSTAARFHAGEILLSAGAAAAWVAVVGVRPKVAAVFQGLFGAAVAFHHSNLRLPYSLERLLAKIIVTPRMHGIHHSKVRGEVDSNFSTVFSWWDRLFGTMRLNVPQDAIDIGVPAYVADAALSVVRSLRLPFERQPDDYWAGRQGSRQPGELGRWETLPPTELAP